MSVLTYTVCREPKAQAVGVAAWRGQIPAVFCSGQGGGQVSAAQAAARRITVHAHSRPMRAIGPRCHELRIVDVDSTWRIIYRIDSDAIVIAEVFLKKTQQIPKAVLDTSRRRLKEYDHAGK
jgi:phage-related protein